MIYLQEVEVNQRYEGKDGWTLEREAEYGGCPGSWVLRHDGRYVDHDQYRNYLTDEHNLSLTDLPW